jgi:hypothetical protein
MIYICFTVNGPGWSTLHTCWFECSSRSRDVAFEGLWMCVTIVVIQTTPQFFIWSCFHFPLVFGYVFFLTGWLFAVMLVDWDIHNLIVDPSIIFRLTQIRSMEKLTVLMKRYVPLGWWMWAAVGNALKFTHEGSVTIHVTVIDQQEISSLSSNKSVGVDVGMCSICLSRSCFKSIFAPFQKGF